MKSLRFKSLLSLFFVLAFGFSLNAQNQNTRSKEFDFTIEARGEKVYEVIVPQGAKKIYATISGHNEMISMKVMGPTDVVLAETTTWSYLSNWRKDLKCSASVVNNDRQKPGTWKVKIRGAVHKGKLKKVKSISGILKIKIVGTFNDNAQVVENNDYQFPITKEFNFTVEARGEKVYEVIVPQGAKKIYATISGHNEMISMEVVGPTDVVLAKTTTWSYLSNWRKDLKCSASVVNNNRQKPGVWKVKIKGAVHKGKLKKVKSVSGKLIIKITGN